MMNLTSLENPRVILMQKSKGKIPSSPKPNNKLAVWEDF